MQIIMTVGIPASSKSSWAKAEVAKDPNNWIRISNDSIREMLNGAVFSKETEKLVSAIRMSMLREAIKRNKSVILDNLNISTDHWDEVLLACQAMNKDITLSEKIFYVDLATAVERDTLRTGSAKVGEEVIKRWWNKSGKGALVKRIPRTVTMTHQQTKSNWKPMVQDPTLPHAVVFDNDGTISLLNGRNPYDASTCDQDLPHEHVIECLRLYYKAGYKVLFVSGREEKDRAPTERFYAKHFPEIKYELYMRPTGSMEKDVIIKDRIFNDHIKGKYFVAGWWDDRLQICDYLYENGMPLFRVGNPRSDF